MNILFPKAARPPAWLLAAALLAAAPGTGAAATSAASERMLAPLLATSPHLAGPLRLLAAYGTPTSAWRSVAHNRQVGGMPNSYHLQGYAIDVQRRAGVPHLALDAALRRAGYVLLESLDEGDHSHFAFVGGRSAPRPVIAPKPDEVAEETPPPPAPAGPRVAADDHGTLLIDGEQPAKAADPAGIAPALASAR
ncbi:D-Ala-D-Ala carboxypeptidase family metallohydrolase [Sphingomonas humi]|uniref:Peptidase M15A C-terminal domain-containing protein n=1 Tax=Sphingomonas humi TaxID=335630 RepID=A0ABP7RLB9_9SPHN